MANVNFKVKNSIDLGSPLTTANGGTGLTTIGTALQILRTNAGATGLEWATPSGGGGATLSDDTTTNASRYLTFADATSGSMTTAYVSSTKLYFNPSTGTLNATNFNSLSDQQFKTDIRVIENSLDIIGSLDGVAFKWIDTEMQSYGVIAQDVEQVIPALVHINEEGIRSVNYNGLIGFLIEAVKELTARVEELESR